MGARLNYQFLGRPRVVATRNISFGLVMHRASLL